MLCSVALFSSVLPKKMQRTRSGVKSTHTMVSDPSSGLTCKMFDGGGRKVASVVVADDLPIDTGNPSESEPSAAVGEDSYMMTH